MKTPLVVADLRIDPAKFEVRIADRQVELTNKEFDILHVLAAEPGRPFTRAQILEQVFGFDHQVLDRTVDAHAMNLRRKIEQDPARPRYVLTVQGRGYKFTEPHA